MSVSQSLFHRVAASLAMFLALQAVVYADPCCTSCAGTTVKYWALDSPNNECAVTCIDPNDKIKTAELAILTFGKAKQAGDVSHPCANSHFSTYNRTDIIGAGPVKIQMDKYTPDAVVPLAEAALPSFVVADMHDGDQKAISFGTLKDGVATMTIKPHANNQTWTIEVEMHFSAGSVSGLVDFDVPGKPSPPPCNLSVALWIEQSGIMGKGCKKHTLEFTDPTGTISKDPKFPLNTWVELGDGACSK